MSKNTTVRNFTDTEYISGMKEMNPMVIKSFFYTLISYTLHDIRVNLLKSRVSYDELVNELYIYLSPENWRKLDSFAGLNGCTLKSWMVTLTWRYFMQQKRKLLGECSDEAHYTPEEGFDTSMLTDHMLDIETTLQMMPNRRYASAMEMLIAGYTPEEMAQILGVSVDNLYNIKHRALAQFQKIYSGLSLPRIVYATSA